MTPIAAQSTMRPIDQVEPIFNEALALQPGANRDEWLARRCENHPELVAEVASLLDAYDAMSTSPEPVTSAPIPSIPSEQFGPYRLVRLLGQGGMSSVYLAERVDGRFDKQVAVKVMAAFLGGEEFLKRWSAEAQFLASLDHPNIPRLLDSAVSPSGHPYLVVDYVEGEMLDQYCDRRALGVEARLRLFLQMCQAVDYAHRSLVLHRDLKPSNVLVTADGVVKLLDFGTAAQMAEVNNVTVTRARMMTPRYASPEQLRGERPGVTGDVFSLGVILYELLTGAWPFGDPASVMSELRRAAGHASATAPSSAITDEAPRLRSLPESRLKTLLAGDLSAILFKALEFEPARRYQTAGSFADDIVRFLDGRPVEAHPQTFVYRTGKLLRRHWLAVTAAAIFILGLSAATGLALRQARVARAEAQKAQAEAKKSDSVTEFLRGMLGSAFMIGGPDVTVVKMLNAAEARIEKRWKGDPLAEATLRSSLGSSYITLSQPDRGRVQLERALELFQSLGRHVDAADTLFLLGINAQGPEGNAAKAVDYYERALGELNKADKDAPAALVFHVKVYLAGVLQTQFYRLPETRVLLDEALDLAARDSSIPRNQLPPAWTHKGEVLIEEARLDEAEELFRRAIAGNVHMADAWRGLARASYFKQDFRAAADFARRNLDLATGYNRDHLADAAEAEMEDARYQAVAGQPEEAVEEVRAAMPGIRKQYLAGDQLAYYLQASAQVFNKAGRFRDGEQLAREAITVLQQGQLPDKLPLTAECNQDLGEALAGLKRYREAVPFLEHAVSVYRQLGPVYAHTADGIQAALSAARTRESIR